jgi:hypothetical protein
VSPFPTQTSFNFNSFLAIIYPRHCDSLSHFYSQQRRSSARSPCEPQSPRCASRALRAAPRRRWPIHAIRLAKRKAAIGLTQRTHGRKSGGGREGCVVVQPRGRGGNRASCSCEVFRRRDSFGQGVAAFMRIFTVQSVGK